MKPRTVCLACRIVFDGDNDPRIRMLNAEGQDVERSSIPDIDSEAFYNSEKVEVYLACPKGHLLMENSSTRPLIVMSLFGETRSGKDAFRNGLLYVMENHGLFYRQFHHDVHSQQIEANAAQDPITYLAAATQAATHNQRHVPLHITLSPPRTSPGKEINLALFNTGGEDNNVKTGENLLRACPFIPHTDVFVLMIAPPALPLLPQDVRVPPGTEGENTQSRKETLDHIHRVGEALNLARQAARDRAAKDELPEPVPPTDPIVVFALTKCDRYVDVDGFPQEALKERQHDVHGLDPMDLAMYNEQERLHDFVVTYGGDMLLKEAAAITGKIFITAMSGTGSDKQGRPARQASALNRCLDPLILPLMRAGQGRMSLADIEGR